MVIKKLTAKQIARFPEFVDKWVKIGLSTDRADWNRADEAVRNCYKAASLQPPNVILHLGSPLAATLGGIYACLLLNKGSQVGSQVESQVGSQVWSQVGSSYRGAQLWAGWYSYIDFFRTACKWSCPELEKFSYDEALALSCGWTWWHTNVCAISDRIETISRDDNHRLHSTTGPALTYPDGWSIYAIHGVVVTERIITEQKSLTSKDVFSETNAEVRRVIIDLMGYEKFLKTADAKIINQNSDPHWGTLYEVPEIPVRFVKMRNCTPESDGSWKDYILPVPREINTAKDAVLSTWGLTDKEFERLQSRYGFARS